MSRLSTLEGQATAEATVVTTCIDPKLAEPPFSSGRLAPTSAGIATLLNAAASEKLFKTSLKRTSRE
jgi:hypothetical protein